MIPSREIKIGEKFRYKGEVFMRIKFVGCTGVVTLDKSVESLKILAVSLEKFDLIVLDGFDAYVKFIGPMQRLMMDKLNKQQVDRNKYCMKEIIN